jgi:hypothetical protein
VVGFGATTWQWDPLGNTFTNLNVAPPGRWFAAQVGAAAFAAFDGRRMWTWKRGQAAWVQVANVGAGPLPRDGSAGVFDPTRGAVAAFGGMDNAAPMFPGIKVYLDPASAFWDVFSNTTDEWIPPQAP